MYSKNAFARFVVWIVLRLCAFVGISILTSTYAHAGTWDDIKSAWKGEWRCSSLTVEFKISTTKTDGKNWDSISGDEPPDPSGYLSVYQGARFIDRERVARRYNMYDFPAPFFKKYGFILHKGDIIEIRLEDFDDFTRNDYIGTARIIVAGRTMRGRSSNGLFEATVTCEQ